MRTILLLCLAILASCAKETESNISPSLQTVYVKLVLDNYERLDETKEFLIIEVENSANPKTYKLGIPENGIISHTFYSNRKKEIRINYRDSKFSMITSPNEKLEVKINFEELKHSSKLMNIEVEGASKNTNELMLKHGFLVDSVLTLSSCYQSKEEFEMSIREYTSHKLKKLQQQKDIFHKFIEVNRIQDSQFINWAEAKLEYNIASNLLSHPGKKEDRNISVDNALIKKMFSIRSRENDSLFYFSYLDYITVASTKYEILGNVSNTYANLRDNQTKTYNPYFPIHIKLIETHPDDFEKWMMLASIFKRAKQIPQQYENYLQEKIPKEIYNEITR